MTNTSQTSPRRMSAKDVASLFASNFFARETLVKHAPALRSALPPNNQIILAAMPKSGSTLLIQVMARVLEHRAWNYPCYAQNQEDQLYLPLLIRDTLLRKSLSKLHCPASETTLEMMWALNITPIILVRNLFDAVVSARDHIFKQLGNEAEEPGFHASFVRLPEAEQYDHVIRNWLPRVIDFYASWWAARRDQSVPMLWIDYEQLVQDKLASIRQVIEFVGERASDQRIESALAQISDKQSRKNVGTIGRGKALLTQAQQDRIAAMAHARAGVDFSSVGIPPAD